MPKYYGVIDEDCLSLRSPRMIDSDEYNNIWKAFEKAADMIGDGATEVAIVECKYSKRDDCWYEVVERGCITVDASNAHEWFDDGEV